LLLLRGYSPANGRNIGNHRSDRKQIPWYFRHLCQGSHVERLATPRRSCYPSDGFGPWEMPEMRGCLSQFIERRLPVIPVLLPSAPNKPLYRITNLKSLDRIPCCTSERATLSCL
jgi:hypothetical protein